ncbi:MAG: metallophosphoesterase, partial [Candidatus Heimdallarchaeota archaeon]|nr:metallophosphoesterase [Candidatus Heimdallarchaeota archaeon]MCK5049481.1 metallophosphoesterase [Candidatus Heimdallarchaeota archaeon]
MIRIAHISDTHFTTGKEFEKELYLQAIQYINSLDLDFVVHTGDLTHAGLRHEYLIAKELLPLIEHPVYYLIGNHDARNVGYELWEEYMGVRSGYYVEDNYLFVYLDSTIPDKDAGRFGQETISSVRAILQKHQDKKVKIVAFHHHLIPLEKTGRERGFAIDAGEMINCLQDHGVDLILTGHKHHASSYKIEDTIIVSAGTISSLKRRAGEAASFNLITINTSHNIEVSTVSLGSSKSALAPSSPTSYSIARLTRLINANSPKICRIVQLSSTYYGGSDFNSKSHDHGLKLIKRLNADMVIHCGNVSSKGLEGEYKESHSNLKPLTENLYITPGPSDLKHMGPALFTRYYGEDRTIERENMLLYLLNSSQVDSKYGRIGRDRLKKLVNQVDENTESYDKYTAPVSVLVTHHAIIPIPRLIWNETIEDAGEVLRALVSLPIDLVLTGSKHKAFATRVNETILINAGTFSSNHIMSNFGSSFNVIDVLHNGGVIVSEVSTQSGIRRILGI